MNKRIRKKKRVGEFQELAFRVKAKFKEPVNWDRIDQFCDELITFVEFHNLGTCGGIGEGGVDQVVCRLGGSRRRPVKVNVSDCEAVKQFYANHAFIDPASVSVSALFDAWYGPFPE